MNNSSSTNFQPNACEDITEQITLSDDSDKDEEDNQYKEPRLSNIIIEDCSIDPFFQSVDIKDDDKDDVNEVNDKIAISPLNSDELFPTNLYSSEGIQLSNFSNLSESQSQINLNSFIYDSSFLNDNNHSIEMYKKIQTASRGPKYPPPDISVFSYFQDLIGREIDGPKLPSKEEMYAFIEPYSLEQYAKNNFHKGISLIPETIEHMISFSNKPITRPLLNKTDPAKKSIIQKLSTSILIFIKILNNNSNENPKDEKIKEKRDNLLMNILKYLRDDDEIVDECLIILMKTMTKTPNKRSLFLAWKIFITVVYIFYIKNRDILNVVHWFLIHRIFSDDKERYAAYYSFICVHDRSVIGRNYKEFKKSLVIQIPYCAFYGNQMFMCSLYEQVWHQKRKYPALPIPLMLYLIVKALTKNGVMITPNPFPLICKYVSQSSTKSSGVNNNDDDNRRIKKNRYFDVTSTKMKILYNWINELPTDNNALNDGEVYDLIILLLEWLSNLVDPIIPKSMIIEFKEIFENDENQFKITKYNEFIEKLPLLHLNTLKYLIGFLKDVGKNEKYTLQSNQIIAENMGSFFVDTKYALIDPFTMKKITDVAPRFILYCIENLDVTAVYPLNPVYEIVADE